MKKGGKKIINNESKKTLPVLRSIVNEIVHKWEFAFQDLISLFLHSLFWYVHIKSFFWNCRVANTPRPIKKELVKIQTMTSVNVNIVIWCQEYLNLEATTDNESKK